MKPHWVRKEELDTPLCEVFDDVKTNGTAREYVVMSCALLNINQPDLESMSYKDMNEFIDSLDERFEKVQ